MTDNEIIKALKCCRDCKCKECPCYKNIEGEMRCTEIDEEEILELINRQKAEIERLEAEIGKQYEQAEADILGNMADGGTSCHWCIEQHEAKAIKEFAERLTDKADLIKVNAFDSKWAISQDDINNLVKELTER